MNWKFQSLKKITNQTINIKMNLPGHIEEFSQRSIFCFSNLLLAAILCFIEVKEIVKIFQAPATGIKFLQFAPGEYFFVSLKIATFAGILLVSPIIFIQIFLYLIPGLTKYEKNIVIPISFGSYILFLGGLSFSYFLLIPISLNFFIAYGSEVVEPFWSFEQYFDFIIILIFLNSLTFQVPSAQIILGLLGIVSGKKMLSYWKYIVIVCTFIAAIITPSTDPITQLLVALTLLMLYLIGSGCVIILTNVDMKTS